MDTRVVRVHTSGLCTATAWLFERGGPWLAMEVEAALALRDDGPMVLLPPPEARPFVERPLPEPGPSRLSGDEWLVLFGEGEVAPVLRTRLPKLRAAARLVGEGQPTRLVHLTLAQVCLDVVGMRCTLRWNGTRELGAALSDKTSLQAMVAVDGQPVSWPSDELAEVLPTRGSGTVSVSRDALKRAVMPFGGKALRAPSTTKTDKVLRPYQGQQVTMDVTREGLRRARREGARPLAMRTEELPFEAFEVLSASGFEALSSPPRYDIDLRPTGASLHAERLVGKRATLRIQGAGVQERWVHGVLTEVERMHEAPDGRLRVRLESPLITAGHHSRSRTFVDTSFEAVVRRVVEGAGWRPDGEEAAGPEPALVYRLDLPTASTARSFFAQYDETDLAFLTRLLASEGLGYRLTSTRDRVVLVIGRLVVPADGGMTEEAVRTSVRLIAGRPPELTIGSRDPTHAPGRVLMADLGRGEASRCLVTGTTMRLEVDDASKLTCQARLTLASQAPPTVPVDTPRIRGAQIATTEAVEGGLVRVRLPWEADEPALTDWLELPVNGAHEAPLRVGDRLLLTFVDGAPHHPVVTARLREPQGLER